MNGLNQERGFTVAEVLLATAIMALAFVALGSIIPIASYGVQEGNQSSTATFLADQKLELTRNVPWSTAPSNDCLGISASATVAPTVSAGGTCTLGTTTVAAGGALPWFADESASAIPGFGGYSRTVRVTDCGVAPGCAGIANSAMRLVAVTVSYIPLTGIGAAPGPKSVTQTMVVAQR